MSKGTPSLGFHKHTGRFCIRLDGKPIYLGYSRSEASKKADRLIGEWLTSGRATVSHADSADLTIAER